jgi:site-specific DNA-methyltransferase (adenine-specific)
MIIHGDSIEVLRTLEPESVDAVVTDPPYGLGNTSPKHVAECLRAWSARETWQPSGRGFMGREWDAWVPPPELWREVLRVLKPGGHAIVFAGSRTQDLMSVSLRLAGFEVRDVIMWLYGSGFPKSLNVSKAIDKTLGAEDQREVIGLKTKPDGTVKSAREIMKPSAHAGWRRPWMDDPERVERAGQITASATDEARAWEGWGTALKPAYEPAILARKPLRGTVARCVLEHGTGAINVDASRVGDEGGTRSGRIAGSTVSESGDGLNGGGAYPINKGRYPSNVMMDERVAHELGERARYFYTPKASKAEREVGLEGFEKRRAGHSSGAETRPNKPTNHPKRANTHPTVKPIALMRYLVRMVTPPSGTVLDPFAGSGSTLCAAALEGFEHIGVEREGEYVAIARERVAHWTAEREREAMEREPTLFD